MLEHMLYICITHVNCIFSKHMFYIQYSVLRDDLYEIVQNENRHFINVNAQEKFNYFMTTDDSKIVKKVMQYLYCALKMGKRELCIR